MFYIIKKNMINKNEIKESVTLFLTLNNLKRLYNAIVR